MYASEGFEQVQRHDKFYIPSERLSSARSVMYAYGQIGRDGQELADTHPNHRHYQPERPERLKSRHR